MPPQSSGSRGPPFSSPAPPFPFCVLSHMNEVPVAGLLLYQNAGVAGRGKAGPLAADERRLKIILQTDNEASSFFSSIRVYLRKSAANGFSLEPIRLWSQPPQDIRRGPAYSRRRRSDCYRSSV